MDENTRTKGNRAFFKLSKAYELWRCYEDRQLEIHLASQELSSQQRGVRLIQAKIALYETMQDEDALCQWVDDRITPSEPQTFNDWIWHDSKDVRTTVRAILMRIDDCLVKNLNKVLAIRQEADQGAEDMLRSFRTALEIERNALKLGERDVDYTQKFAVDFIFHLSSFYIQGDHDNKGFKRGVKEKIYRIMSKNNSMTYDKTKRIWQNLEKEIDGQIIKGSDGVRMRLRTKDGRLRFEKID